MEQLDRTEHTHELQDEGQVCMYAHYHMNKSTTYMISYHARTQMCTNTSIDVKIKICTYTNSQTYIHTRTNIPSPRQTDTLTIVSVQCNRKAYQISYLLHLILLYRTLLPGVRSCGQLHYGPWRI